MADPLEFPCTVCSAAIGERCRDRSFRVLEVPHTHRQRLARG